MDSKKVKKSVTALVGVGDRNAGKQRSLGGIFVLFRNPKWPSMGWGTGKGEFPGIARVFLNKKRN